jgi:hypothetical protein
VWGGGAKSPSLPDLECFILVKFLFLSCLEFSAHLLSILSQIDLIIVSCWDHQTNSARIMFESFNALATLTNSLSSIGISFLIRSYSNVCDEEQNWALIALPHQLKFRRPIL